ncbi:hypothetical protein C8J56DRAFT_1052712 [Mycena floridula]|nr:hypothetical protein C8J56DRAFT_1052712 [Mycena floridula]
MSTDQKENAIHDQSMVLMTPGESLRLSRPRPRGQSMPARSGATPAARPMNLLVSLEPV